VSNRSNFFTAELAAPRRRLARAMAEANQSQASEHIEAARRAHILHGIAFNQCVENFTAAFKKWTPDQAIIHPHPHFCAHYKRVNAVCNHFGIDGVWLSSDYTPEN